MRPRLCGSVLTGRPYPLAVIGANGAWSGRTESTGEFRGARPRSGVLERWLVDDTGFATRDEHARLHVAAKALAGVDPVLGCGRP